MSCAKDKGPYVFTREQTSFLISLYEQHPLLYEVGNEQFKNKTKKQFAFAKIQEDFNKKILFSNVSLDEIRKKINNIRTQFFSEINKIKKSIVSGSGTDDVYTPTLWCYEQLSFLNTSNPVRESESSLPMKKTDDLNYDDSDKLELLYEGTVEELNSGTTDELVSGSQSRITSPLGSPLARPSTSASWRSDESQPRAQPSKKRKQSEAQNNQAVALMTKATELLAQTNEPVQPAAPMDIIDAFLVTLGAELRQIKNATRCRNLRQKILNLAYDCQREEEEDEN